MAKKQATSRKSSTRLRASKTRRRRANSSGRKVAPLTIGSYLIQRLQACGVDDLFGIPGDFVLNFYGQLEESPIRVIGCTREDNAGYAADAYARVHGIGAVCVTYCVGGLSLCNFDRRGFCREVTGGRDQWFARYR